MPEEFQFILGVCCLLCVATCVMSVEHTSTAKRDAQYSREQESLLETIVNDGQDLNKLVDEKTKNKRQETRPSLVLKLLQEKLDDSPISNHLGAYHVPRPASFTVPEEQLYHPQQQPHPAVRAPVELPGRNNEEDLKQPPPKYQYIYKVRDPEGNDFGHTETRVGDRTWGQYFVQLPDGREKVVRYWADDSGFHAEVAYTGTSRAEHQ